MKRVLSTCAGLFVFILLVAGVEVKSLVKPGAPDQVKVPLPAATKVSASQKLKVRADFGRMPLYFVPNDGQLEAKVDFYVQGQDRSIWFNPEGLTFMLAGSDSSETRAECRERARNLPPGMKETGHGEEVKLQFVGAESDVHPQGEEPTGAVISYFRGGADDSHTGLPAYSRIVYHDLWPGIDLAYYGTVNKLKYEFIVRPGADPSIIRLAYRGAANLTVDNEGRLEVKTQLGGFQDDVPVAYQEIEGVRREVTLTYDLQVPEKEMEPEDSVIEEAEARSFVYGFKVGEYDRTQALVLDPAILVYCGYIGTVWNDYGNDIAVDSSGCAYVTGYTHFPDAWRDVDILVAKVNASGTGFVYLSYFAGADDDYGHGIAVDAWGCVYVTGETYSEEDTFPVYGGPGWFHNGDPHLTDPFTPDAFVAKLNSSGTNRIFCGYIGGKDYDRGYGIALDGSGGVYVTGHTYSSQTDYFPATVGPDLSYNGGRDAFVAKVDASGLPATFVYCGYIGGNLTDYGHDIAVNDSGCAFVIGETEGGTFPTKVGPDLTYNGGSYDGFVAKVNAAGTGLVYCGYIGGSGNDYGEGIAVDGSGNAYLTGYTYSTEATFPKVGGPDLTHNGGSDAYVAKINAAGTALVYCGYIGGSDTDYGRDIDVDGAGNAYVTGSTKSTETTFPVMLGPDLTHNGNYDAYVAKVNAAGTKLNYCGYIGGSDDDYGYGIALDNSGNTFVTGVTLSGQVSFPVTVGPDLTWNILNDAFVVKIQSSSSVLCDFGAIGLWKWNSNAWLQMSGSNPGFMIAADTDGIPDSEFVVDYDAVGLWLWDNAGWGQLSGVDADFAVAADTDGSGDQEIAVDFGSLGLWLWDSGAWSQLSGVNPQDMVAADADGNGDKEVVVDFGMIGLWKWDSGAWEQLSGVNPHGMVAADADGNGSEEIYAGFGAFGSWKWDAGTWSQISGSSPEYMISADTDGNGNDEVIGDFGSAGIWRWDGSSWSQISGYNPEYMIAADTDGSGDDEIVVDLGASGLWEWNDDVLSQLATPNPEYMIAADTDADGVKEVIADFGGLGLWHWDDGTWTLLTMASPDNMVAEEIQ
jgi:hypothetical protein